MVVEGGEGHSHTFRFYFLRQHTLRQTPRNLTASLRSNIEHLFDVHYDSTCLVLAKATSEGARRDICGGFDRMNETGLRREGNVPPKWCDHPYLPTLATFSPLKVYQDSR